jgi:hypothetical protein
LSTFTSLRSAADAVLAGVCVLLAAACAADSAPKDAASSQRFPQLGEREAWERMARPTPPLPAWALALVDTLPQTTAAQIDLDNLHRTANPLGPVLSARVRWAVADANRCAYSKAVAEADLKGAGVEQAATDPSALSDVERVAVDFARKLTLEASEITDEEAAAMLAALGPDDAVALVHTVAHANFQDRIFLALGLTRESAGPKPPFTVGAIAEQAQDQAFRSSESVMAPGKSSADSPTYAWQQQDVAQLRARLEQQKARQARIPPADAARLARLPRPNRERAGNSGWGRISMGYQPALTSAWYRTMGAFDSEAQLDLVFANSIFWVITRSTNCFY